MIDAYDLTEISGFGKDPDCAIDAIAKAITLIMN